MATSFTALAVCLAAVAIQPTSEMPEEKVDLIEINHFHDDQGRPVFDQIIFYDWSAADGRYQVRDWRLLKNQNQIPLRNSSDGGYTAVWSDFKAQDTVRTTKAKVVRESWTQYDPELVEREFLAENKRRKLRDMSASTKRAGKADASPSDRARTAPAGGTLRPLQNPTRISEGPRPSSSLDR